MLLLGFADCSPPSPFFPVLQLLYFPLSAVLCSDYSMQFGPFVSNGRFSRAGHKSGCSWLLVLTLMFAVGVVVGPARGLGQGRPGDKTSSAPSQPAAPAAKPDVSVQVRVVNVPAVVRDKHGKIVNNLTKTDFVL